MERLKRDTLVLFPCCACKYGDGEYWGGTYSPLAELMDGEAISHLLKVRTLLLEKIQGEKRYCTGKYIKNALIKAGPDFGQQDTSGRYLPAIDRNIGALYTAEPGFANLVREHIRRGEGPHLLIISALYGLLHPLELIQDYMQIPAEN